MTAPDNPETGPIGDRVLYEDEHVRIWEMVLEPGQRSPLHHHENDYVVVVVEGDHVTVEPAEASEERSGDGYGSVEVTPGRASSCTRAPPRWPSTPESSAIATSRSSCSARPPGLGRAAPSPSP